MATTANHVLLRRITLSASAASVTFDSIPQTGYTDLKLVVSGRTTGATNGDLGYINFNGVSTNQSSKRLQGDGASATSSSFTTLYFGNAGANDTANTFGNAEIYIPNYTTANPKSVSIDSVNENNATTAYARMFAGLWNSTAAITTIDLYPNNGSWAAGSSFSLYGIANAATTPALAPKADGGDIIKTDGTYWYHAFTGTGSFTPQVNLTADVLVVAGGGGGGSGNNSGGGGAGGLLGFTSQALTGATSYNCIVGSGGATANPNGVNGSDSRFGSLTLVKGGGYGAGQGNTGGTGGSGGGNPYDMTGSAGQPTSGQGYAGGPGQGVIAPDYYGGGGGGAAEAGNTDGLGSGGDGSSAYSSWGSATGLGQLVSSTYYFAGGGGGAGQYSSTSAPGGDGGGGRGVGISGVAGAGVANTGGGGGGSGNSGGNTGGAGGSGVIIIRYPV